MKIGFDIRPALFDYAGVARYSRELAIELSRHPSAPQLEMFAPSWRGGRNIPPELANASNVAMNRGWLPKRIMHQLHHLPGLGAGRLPKKVDVFHWTDYDFPSVRSCATLMTVHDAAFAVDPKFHGRDTTALIAKVRAAINRANIVVVVSEPSVRDAEMLGVNPEDVRVIPNGVSPFFQPPKDPAQARDYLLTVGTFEPRKNYMRILKALEIAWQKDAAPDWHIIGRPGWDYGDFFRKLEKSKFRKRVHLKEGLSESQLRAAYQGALALIYPSLHEGFGLPVLEAMACATPVVVGDKTAPSWVAGEAGMRVDPRNVDSIAEGIERIVSEGSWRKQAAAVLHRRAQEFSWEKAAEQTMAAYRDAIQAFAER
jgi:glycosyltransferase involved in cell wall biosynthesis